MSAASEAPAALEAMEDARRTGVGFVRVLQITTEQYRVERLDPSSVVVLAEAGDSQAELAELVLDVACGFCGAGPREWCTTVSGARASYPHVCRIGPVHEASRVGFREGVLDGMRRALAVDR